MMPDFNAIFTMSGDLIAFRLIAAALLAVLHGVTLTILARALGDSGPAQDGRMSLNPLAHLHPLGLLALVVTRMGWIRPIDTGAASLRGGVWGVLALVAIGLAILPLSGALAWQARPLLLAQFPGSNPAIFVIGTIETLARMSIWLAVLNLVPLPPFTAGLLLSALAPRLHRLMMRHLTWICVALTLVLLSGMVQPLVLPAVTTLERLLLP